MASIEDCVKFNVSSFLEPNYKGFLERFYEDWTNPLCAFHEPAERTCMIGRMIMCLINNDNALEAKKIFDLAERANAWDTGLRTSKPGKFFRPALANIYRARMLEAQDAIKKAVKKKLQLL